MCNDKRNAWEVEVKCLRDKISISSGRLGVNGELCDDVRTRLAAVQERRRQRLAQLECFLVAQP